MPLTSAMQCANEGKANLTEYVKLHANTKPHLTDLTQ